MKKIIVLLIFTTFYVSGCATKLPPKIEISTDATVGYMSLLDAKSKHTHVGTTIFSNFNNPEVSNWNMDEVVEELVANNLKGKANYNLVKLTSSKEFLDQKLDLISSGWDTFKANPELTPLLSNLKSEKGIDILIVFNPYNNRVEYNVPVTANGFGLYTRCVFKICRAQALNHITVNIFATDPGSLLAWGIAKEHEYPLDIDFSGGVKNLSSSEIDKAKPFVVQHLTGRFDSAISRAGL